MEHSRPDQNAEKGTPLDLRRLATVLAAGFYYLQRSASLR